ncbi:asteroid [Acrasis kona]|uniref:Asteroid n=1 Tax=Acrasis kona TaxID=1008807 RepID=A0AAW2ZG50_9EUKA
MGIKYLSSFIERSVTHKETISLTELGNKNKPANILVDTNSFLFFLFEDSHIDFTNGGDHEQFVIYLNKIFKMFQNNSNITFVFDGCETDKKRQTILDRMNERMEKHSKHLSHTSERPVIKPFLCSQELLIAVADTYKNIKCIQAPFEADPMLAEMAMERTPNGELLYAGVISSDSDFMIYPSNGLIQQNSLRWETQQGSVKLKADIYTTSTVAKTLNLKDPLLLPVFACLTENDYINNDHLQCFRLTLENQGDGRPVKRARLDTFCLVIDFINEFFEFKPINDENVYKCLMRALGEDDFHTIELCFKVYKEYSAKKTVDLDHISYPFLFKNFIPYKKTMDESMENYTCGKLQNPAVTMITQLYYNMGIPFEDYNKEKTSGYIWGRIRERFLNYAYFHNVKKDDDDGKVHTMQEYFVANGAYTSREFDVSLKSFKKLFEKSKNRNSYYDYFNVLGISKEKARKLKRSLKSAYDKDILPMKPDCYAFIVSVLFCTFKKKQIKEGDWQYLSLLCSICSRSVIDKRDSFEVIYNNMDKYKFDSDTYCKKHNKYIKPDQFDLEQLTISASFATGLKLCLNINQWFGSALHEARVNNSLLLFSGTNFAQIYKTCNTGGTVRLSNKGKNKRNPEKICKVFLGTDEKKELYETLKKIIADLCD